MLAQPLSAYQQYHDFVARILKLKSRHIPSSLRARISNHQLLHIVDALTSNRFYAEQIKNLKPYGSIRFDKRETMLGRTFSVFRDPSGEFGCILETKSKTEYNTKCPTTKFAGSYKQGKTAWRLDDVMGPIPYVSMRIQVDSLQGYQYQLDRNLLSQISREIQFSWEKVRHPAFQRSYLGSIYRKGNHLYQSVYSKKGIPLSDLKQYNIQLSSGQIESIAKQLLEGLKAAHDLGYVLQDIKPANILCFFDQDRNIVVRFNDFGSVPWVGNTALTETTLGYESPEIALAQDSKNSRLYTYFHDGYTKYGVSYGKCCANYFSIPMKDEYHTPHPANDVWSLGVVLYELYNKKNPSIHTSITDHRLKRMLDPYRHSRASVSEALELFKLPQQPPLKTVFHKAMNAKESLFSRSMLWLHQGWSFCKSKMGDWINNLIYRFKADPQNHSHERRVSFVDKAKSRSPSRQARLVGPVVDKSRSRSPVRPNLPLPPQQEKQQKDFYVQAVEPVQPILKPIPVRPQNAGAYIQAPRQRTELTQAKMNPPILRPIPFRPEPSKEIPYGRRIPLGDLYAAQRKPEQVQKARLRSGASIYAQFKR